MARPGSGASVLYGCLRIFWRVAGEPDFCPLATPGCRALNCSTNENSYLIGAKFEPKNGNTGIFSLSATHADGDLESNDA